MKEKTSGILLNLVLIIALICWFTYLGIGLFGSTDLSSGMLERNSYKELYTAELSDPDGEEIAYNDEYICQIEKRNKDYKINWIIVDDQKYEVIMEEVFYPEIGTAVDTELGYFELKVLECQHESSFVLDIKFILLLGLSVILVWRIFIKRNF